MIHGDVRGKEEVLVRVHDQCFTSEVFGSMRCDCRYVYVYMCVYVYLCVSHGLVLLSNTLIPLHYDNFYTNND